MELTIELQRRTQSMSLNRLLSWSSKRNSQSLSRQDLETLFWLEENRRDQVFEQSRLQQQYDFATTSQAWFKGEEERNATLKQALSDAEREIEQQGSEHLKQFKELLDVWTQSAASRDAKHRETYDEAYRARLDMFKQEQEQRRGTFAPLVIEWKDICEKGKMQREAERRKVIESCQKQFEDMIREVQDVFEEAQSGREKAISSQVSLFAIADEDLLT